MHVIIEAERGCALPDDTQLAKYASTVTRGPTGALLIAAGGITGLRRGATEREHEKSPARARLSGVPRKESNLQPSD